MERKPIKKKTNVVSINKAKKKPNSGQPTCGRQLRKIPEGEHQPRKHVQAWEPTVEDRARVRRMIAAGITPERIARVIHPDGPISHGTVRRVFKEEIADGKTQICDEIMTAAFELLGKSGPVTIHLLKTVVGLKEWEKPVGATDKDRKTIAEHMYEAVADAADTLPSKPKEEEEQGHIADVS